MPFSYAIHNVARHGLFSNMTVSTGARKALTPDSEKLTKKCHQAAKPTERGRSYLCFFLSNISYARAHPKREEFLAKFVRRVGPRPRYVTAAASRQWCSRNHPCHDPAALAGNRPGWPPVPLSSPLLHRPLASGATPRAGAGAASLSRRPAGRAHITPSPTRRPPAHHQSRRPRRPGPGL